MILLHNLDRHGLPASPEDAGHVAPGSLAPRFAPVWQHSTRYADQPTRWSTRLFGIGGVGAVALLILGCMFITWQTYSAPPPVVTLSVFDVAPPAGPPEPEREIPPGPEQMERKKPLPEPERPKIEPPEIRLSSDNPVVVPIPTPVPDPGPPVEKTTAPEVKPAPPAPQLSTDKPTWEGQVLAALNRKKRYPPWSMSRREQGVPYIRFVMDRDGKVLSVSLERSSGYPSLDREAVALPRRAQPLPKPPEGVQPGQAVIELVVPVQFFMK